MCPALLPTLLKKERGSVLRRAKAAAAAERKKTSTATASHQRRFEKVQVLNQDDNTLAGRGHLRRERFKSERKLGETEGRRRKICTTEGCTSRAERGGVCIRHGAKVKRCNREGCTNQVVK